MTDNEIEELIQRHPAPHLYSQMAEASLNNAESIRSAIISYQGY